MGQLFEVVNLDNPFPVMSLMGGKFGECFWDMDNAVVVDTAVMHALWRFEKGFKFVTARSLREFVSPRDGYVLRKQSHANATLATELVDIILQHIEDLTDLVCFVVTCQRYYEIGRRHLEARLEEAFFYSWAGNRLICLGDYGRLYDLPDGMLTNDEIEFLEDPIDNDTDSESEYSQDDDIWTQLADVQRLQPDYELNEMKARYHKKHLRVKIYFFSLSHHRHLRPPARVSYLDEMVISELVKKTLPLPSPGELYKTYSYVLRNLTTKEYIRGAAIREVWGTPDMPFLRALRFVHLLMLRTTWSSDRSLSLAYDGPLQIHRGAWAGHRFDFTGIKTVQNAEGGSIDGWVDVSKEVIDELITVFAPEAEDLNEYYSHSDDECTESRN